MDQSRPSTSRKAHQLRVPVLPHEAQEIQRNAAQSGLPVAAYLRELGLRHTLRGMFDHQRVEELAAMHTDLVRLGELLRLCLADDVRSAACDAATLRAALAKIACTQDEIHALMRAVVLSATQGKK